MSPLCFFITETSVQLSFCTNQVEPRETPRTCCTYEIFHQDSSHPEYRSSKPRSTNGIYNRFSGFLKCQKGLGPQTNSIASLFCCVKDTCRSFFESSAGAITAFASFSSQRPEELQGDRGWMPIEYKVIFRLLRHVLIGLFYNVGKPGNL